MKAISPRNFTIMLLAAIVLIFIGFYIRINLTTKVVYNYRYTGGQNSVYYKGSHIKGSDNKTFEILDQRYAKDRNQAYYLSHSGDPNAYKDKLLGELHGMLFPKYTLKIIENADPDSFISLPYSSRKAMWALDKYRVYWRGEHFEIADVTSFKIINGPGFFAQDKIQRYDGSGYWPTPMKDLP